MPSGLDTLRHTVPGCLAVDYNLLVVRWLHNPKKCEEKYCSLILFDKIMIE